MRFRLALVFVAGMLGFLFLVPKSALAATYTVTKTADTNDGVCDADCSLREALAAANANAGADTIAFNIPGSDGGYSSTDDTWAITLGSGLTISASQSVTFDGTTQTGNGTFPTYGGKIVVQIAGFTVLTGGSGSDVTVKRLTFKSTATPNSAALLSLGTGGGNVLVQNSYITHTGAGTQNNFAVTGGSTTSSTVTFTNNEIENYSRGIDAVGGASTVIDLENNLLVNIPSIGLRLNGTNSIVKNNNISTLSDQGVVSTCNGGTCTIDGNTLTGTGSGFANIVLSGAGTQNVTNNTINADNNRAISSTASTGSILIQGNTITGGSGSTSDGKIEVASIATATVQNNTINVTNAIPIFILGTPHVHIVNNVLTSTFGYTPINLSGGTEGSTLITANDAGDTDTGPNNLMNFPIISSANYVGGGQYHLVGTLDYNVSETPITIDIYKSDNESSGHGGSTAYLGSTTVRSDGTWDTTVSISGDSGTQRVYFTTTATNSSGDTSEFSLNYSVGGSDPQPQYSTCQEKAPTSAPIFYNAVSNTPTSIILYFYPPQGDYTNYMLEYGTTSNKYTYGNSNIGSKPMSSYTVTGLTPGTKYYFRVGANNGCATGGWGNEWSGATLTYVSAPGLFISPTPSPEATSSGTSTPFEFTVSTVPSISFPQIGGVLSDVNQKVSEFLDKNGKIATAVAIVSVPVVGASLVGFSYIGLAISNLFDTNLTLKLLLRFLQALGIIPVGDRDGIVYDIKTDVGVPFAIVLFRSIEKENKVIETLVTDHAGVYGGLRLSGGKYQIEVKHHQFTFPTIFPRPVYFRVKDFYKGETFSIASQKEIQFFTIPVDEKEKQESRNSFSLTAMFNFLGRISNILFWTFFLLSILLFAFNRTLINGVVLGLYILFFLKKIAPLFARPTLVGRVIDRSDNPIPGTIVRLSDKGGSTVEVTRANMEGRFKFYSRRGEYRIFAVKNGYINLKGGLSDIQGVDTTKQNNIEFYLNKTNG